MKNKMSLLALMIGLTATSAFAFAFDCDGFCKYKYEGYGADPALLHVRFTDAVFC